MGKQFRLANFQDLREYVSLLEELGGKSFKGKGKQYRGSALHRVDRNPSLGVFIGRNGGIVVHDFAQDKSWSYYSYLQELGREDLAQLWSKRFEEWNPLSEDKREGQAYRKKDSRLGIPERKVEYALITPSTDEWEASARARMREALEAIENGEHPKTLHYMERRGLNPEYAYAAGLGADKDGIAIPVYDEEIRLKNVKIRRLDDSRGRFFYLFKDRGNGYYFSPDFAWEPMLRVVIIEGELNAAAVYDAMDVPTIGLPGASTGLSRELVEKLKKFASEVIIMTDQDDAGRRLMENILDQLVVGGYEMGRIYIPMEDRYHRDTMDILKDKGLDYLTEQLKERFYKRSARLRKSVGVGTGLAKIAQENQSGLNTKRSLAMAIGIEVSRRHASYVPQEERESMKKIEDYLTEKAIKRGLFPAHARKTVRRWMDRANITPRTSLFIIYEYNGVRTGVRTINSMFCFQRQEHPLLARYRLHDEKSRVIGFDIPSLLEDAVTEILSMAEEVILYFQKLKERIDEERRLFAEWIRHLPHLLKYIVRSKDKTGNIGTLAAGHTVRLTASPPLAKAS